MWVTRIHNGLCLKRCHAGLNEETHESQLNVVFFLKIVLESVSQLHNCTHIALLEGGEQSVCVLCILESLRNFKSHSAHRLSLLAPLDHTDDRWQRGALDSWLRGLALSGS